MKPIKGPFATATRPLLASVALFFLLVLPAGAQTAGPPSGSGIQPYVVAGNPDCAAIGLGFGMKIEGSPNGTFPLTSVLTGGAPPDPSNSVTVSNSDGIYFDWSSTLGLDAVIVKGGPNANIYVYDPEAWGDTSLHAPINASNGLPAGLSHLEFCYDYEVSVAKSADADFIRTWNWSIEKSVTPAAWALFTGDTGTSRYTVAVDRTGFTDSDWAVSGTILVENATPFDAHVTSITDAISGFGAVAVDCPGGLPQVIPSGDTLACAYATPLPDGTHRLNTATVATSGVVGGGEASAPVAFGAPGTEVDAEVHVSDTNGMAWGPVGDDASWFYDVSFDCDADEGLHGNDATLVETGDTDSAAVSVACYGLTVTKDAETSYARDWTWSIVKTARPGELLLSPGQVYDVGYHVEVDAVATDRDFLVTGEITIANSHPARAATLDGVSDEVSVGHAASVSCPSNVVPAGGSVVCTYEAALPDAAGRTNVATAAILNVDIAYDLGEVLAGTTDFSSPAVPVIFGEPSQVTDECVDVDDSLHGPLGPVCAGGAPGVFDYLHAVGPFASPDECGLHEIVNVASFLTGDTGTTGDASATVNAEVACGTGCTLTPGYWKTHSEHGPAPYDETWAELPAGADTPFFGSGQSWHEMLWTPPRGNAYYVLGHAYAATALSFLDGASAPPEVIDAMDAATALFETWTPDEIGALKGNRPPRPEFLMLAGLLDMYNNGLLGPGHCSEDVSSAP